jgi:hypothetical protein
LSHGLKNCFGAFSCDERNRQPANGENLVRPEQRIDFARLMIDVDDVVEITAPFVPEAGTETFLTPHK